MSVFINTFISFLLSRYVCVVHGPSRVSRLRRTLSDRSHNSCLNLSRGFWQNNPAIFGSNYGVYTLCDVGKIPGIPELFSRLSNLLSASHDAETFLSQAFVRLIYQKMAICWCYWSPSAICTCAHPLVPSSCCVDFSLTNFEAVTFHRFVLSSHR